MATVELIKTDVLEQLEHIVRQRLEGARAERASEFVRCLYAHVPPGDLVRMRPEDLYAGALSFLTFAEQRTPGQPAVRLYTPRLAEHGWQSPHTIVELINDDMPFLVDSVRAELTRLEANIELIIHPIIAVNRDASGRLLDVVCASPGATTSHESMMQFHVRAQPAARFEEIERALLAVLADVRLAVGDFAEMRAKCSEVARDVADFAVDASDESREEIVAFLDWLNQNHFSFIGYRYCEFHEGEGSLKLVPRAQAGLGILRDPEREVFEGFQPPRRSEVLRIFKANRRSTVHRPIHLDAIVLPDPRRAESERLGSAARLSSERETGVHMFVGLFTLEAYSRSPSFIPLLRSKLASTLERAELLPESYDGKRLRYILETYPRDELFQISVDNLLSIALGILYLQERQRVALFARRDPFDRFVSCLVYVPRERMDTSLRLRIQEVLGQAFSGSITAYYTHLDDQPLARLHLIVKTPSGIPPHVDHGAVERKLNDATRSWSDRLQTALIHELGEETGFARVHCYANAFPTSYRERFDEITAVNDIEFIEQALERRALTLHLYRPIEAAAGELSIKIFSPTGFVQLSDVLPVLENMGLRVISEVPYSVRLEGAVEFWVHDLSAVADGGFEVDLGAVREHFLEVLAHALDGTRENDSFNRLILHAGFTPADVRVIRVYAKYLHQVRAPFTLSYMQAALERHAGIAKLLVELFALRFEPGQSTQPPRSDRGKRLEEVRAAIAGLLDAVTSLDEDRILRRFLNVIEATVRTNSYQRDASGSLKDYVAMKFDSQLLTDLPAPQPHREIFVCSPWTEGVHLRFGEVARGGLRWSDRLEDYRTEVLGLVKSQQVKNAVIVPVGSKGGFVVKRPPPPDAGRDAQLAEGIRCYRTFVQGLLDLTDNRVGDRVVTPEGVVALDGPDPYLVVAADKGTATFSDIANEISTSNGFWLDDAFASGGSAGYDHKKMGITARGAWESVKRHFRELGKDIQTQDFTVIGVGDMSGDVFGNGMLLSRHVRLVAAFNHQHIFIDPNPNPELSFEERRRLFSLPRSTWKDYDPALISEGGGVFERSAKSIELSVAAQQVLGVDRSRLTPNELISKLLRAPVELLFFGGIGTYVKSSEESNESVGDRTNDCVRIDGGELCAQVIGEGANLGMTQRGRVEFALRGGRCNTDFIDNSAGVDCSDHEVNIKILLGEVERAGDLTRKQRDQLLVEMTDEVAALVLRDNYLQTQALSATQAIGVRFTDRLTRVMKELERAGRLNRELESLPDSESLSERVHLGVGLTRPELCILLSYVKNWLYAELLASRLPDEPSLEIDLFDYFPDVLEVRFRPWILQHRLRREIVATVVTNDLINRVGIAFVHEVGELTGVAAPDVALAYVAARELHQIRELWRQVEELDDRVPTSVQTTLLLEAGRALLSTTTWLLRKYGASLDLGQHLASYREGLAELREGLEQLLTQEEQALFEATVQSHVTAQVPHELARRVASFPLLAAGLDIIEVSKEVGYSVSEVARLYFQVGQRFGFEWLRRVARRLPTDRAWDKQAVTAMIDELFSIQRQLAVSMLKSCDRSTSLEELLTSWTDSRRALVARTQQLVAELEAAPVPDFAMLMVANRQLRALLPGGR